MNKTKEERIQEHLERIKEIMSEAEVIEEQSWPQLGDKYWLIDEDGDIVYDTYQNDSLHQWKKASGNMFRTEDETIMYKEQLLVTQIIRKIAEELNNGEKPDWNDDKQSKHRLCYSTDSNTIRADCWTTEPVACISCLDEKEFLDRAIEHVGRPRLINYLMNYK